MKEVRNDDGTRRLRLETWGEIAQHLGVEVRTAQRWEARLKLPVRRLDGSQSVFAFADELDVWRARREVTRSDAAPPPPEPPPPSPLPQPAPVEPARPVRRVQPAWIFAALAAAVAVVFFVVRPRDRVPAMVAVEGSRLVAINGTGSGLWSHDFSEPVAIIESGFRPELRKWWQLVDIEGDGRHEVVIVLSHFTASGEPFDVLHCFESNGALRYSYTPKLMLSFEAGQYAGPWVFRDIEPLPQEKSLWVAFEHSPWWPSGIVSIDVAGQATLRYVQPGSVKILRTMLQDGRPLVLAGGVNTEYASASLAQLDPAAPPATAPQTGAGQFTCIGCPAGRPVKYVLFPASPFNRAEGLPYNRVDALSIGDVVRVQTYEGTMAGIHYQLSRDLEVQAVRPTDSYWTSQPRSGVPWPPPQAGPLEMAIRTWSQDGWSTARVPYAGPAPPARSTEGAQ